jgi:hypothetical protein
VCFVPIVTGIMHVSSGQTLTSEGVVSMNCHTKQRRRNREKRPITLGRMQVERTRHSEPSFYRALLAVGLIDAKACADHAWFVWQCVCFDPEVIRRSMRLEKSKQIHLPSVTAPFQNGTLILQAMTGQQISAFERTHRRETRRL